MLTRLVIWWFMAPHCTWAPYILFFHSFIHSLIHSFTDWLTDSLRPLTHSFIYLYWYPCTINKLPKLSHRVPVHPTLKVILWLCSALMVVIVVFLQAVHIFLHVFFTFTCYNIYFIGITVVRFSARHYMNTPLPFLSKFPLTIMI